MRRNLTAVLIVLLAAGALEADTLTMEDGTVYHGQRVGTTKTRLAFKTDGKLRWFDLADVAKIAIEKRAPEPRPEPEKPEPEEPAPEPPQPEPGPDEPPKAKRKTVKNSVGMTLVWIPPGQYVMGSPREEHARSIGNPEPQRRARITRGFFLGTCEVTQGQWKKVMGTTPWRDATPSTRPKMGDDLTAVCVTWKQAAQFCQRLSRKERRRYRLPHEVEWEYACRAGTQTAFYTGDTLPAEQANFDPERGRGRGGLMPVGALPPNPWGLHEMHGNASEWCRRYRRPPPPGMPPVDDPSRYPVARGGSWRSEAGRCRSAYRQYMPLSFEDWTIGFRVVLDPKGSTVQVKQPRRQQPGAHPGQPRGRPKHVRPN
jgi:formylglycine-generating enzyme required for sulfatase activity